MRSVVFVERLEFEFSGNVFPNAVVLGDVDNDNENELVVGNVEGDLIIFKGSNTVPWASCSDLGMIICIGIGDICNSGKNCLVTISGEGLCSIFNNSPASKAESVEQAEADVANGDATLSPCYTQHLSANIKVVLIDDIDGDGKTEFVVGHTDRVVSAYRWVEKQQPTTNETSPFIPGKFILLQKWHLNGQIGSLSLSRHPDGRPKLIVSQPGCNYAELLCSWVRGQGEELTGPNNKAEPFVKWHPITNKRARNANVSTELVGRICRSADCPERSGADAQEGKDPQPSRMAMCTLDGTLMMIEEDKILWSLLVDHQLFALTKLDINCDGQDEVVACAWDGQTYIVNHSRESVRFHFQENVCAFCAGQYSTTGANKPCLVYATFNKRIYLYWNVQIPRIPSADLQLALSQNDTVQQKLKELDIDVTDTSKLRELYQWCFYGNHTKKTTEEET
ncbi:KICSTOR complex protein ITFG2-like isoform X2 [Acanthaster planci]|uniref:KICSTOR complex protein ITFG2-like isoform X2 n=1 Tax=Acanthaster planci TaxID=133434 RepID=A0A8B7ZUR0_ACAPL|nr:KICSTOR complex protein ITFG2-like isoform X2 [Acanthaster planci]